MNRTRASLLASTLFAIIGAVILAVPTYGLGPSEEKSTVAKVSEDYGKLPLSFEANQGQTAPEVKFLSRGPGYGLFLTPTEAVLTLTRAADGKADQAEATAVGMKLVGAKAKPEMVGVDPLSGKSHYFIGNDPKQWHTNVAQYAKVKYRAVYPGIDLIYYGNQRQLEYDLVVAPGADPKKIALAFQGVKTITIDKDGQLVLHTGAGDLIQRKPIVYQETNGERKLLEGSYVLKGKQQVGFEVARYDTSKPLVIDPVLAYSTYLGGSACVSYQGGYCNFTGDAGFSIAVDSAGNAYVTGRTYDGLPITSGAFDEECGGPRIDGSQGGWDGLCRNVLGTSDGPGSTWWRSDGFVTKLNANGTLNYSTYLGGQYSDVGTGIAVDSTGHAYVTGYTHSGNFPTTLGAYDTSCGCNIYTVYDGFVTKLAPDGASLVYSTFLGGSAADFGDGIAVDVTGNAYVTGTTNSVDFPTVSAAQALAGGGNDAFVAKLNPIGTNLVYSTFLGGSGDDAGYGIGLSVAGDGSVNAHVTGSTTSANFPYNPGAYQTVPGGGSDAYITRLNVGGTAFDYSTYLGGNGNDYGYGIGLDSLASGWNVYVTGSTASTNFPTTIGAFTGAFVSKLDLDAGNQLVYSTNPGGSSGNAIAVTGAGNAYVAGANGNDAFVTSLDAAGTSQVYTFPLGGNGADAAYGIALDSTGSAYITGLTDSTDLPTTPGAPQAGFGGGPTDIFVSKIAIASAVQLSAATYSVNETDSTITITVTRSGLSTGAISVDYATSNGAALAGSDYTATSGTISFADGETGSKDRTIPITNDTDVESPETFNVTLSNPVGNVYLNSPGTAVVTIVDDDPGVVFSAAAYTVGEEAGTARIYVNRTGTAGGAFSVQYATSDGSALAGSDYTQTNGTLNFGATDTQKYFDVPISPDTEGEPYETVNLALTNPTGGAVVGIPGTAILSIVDNDASSSPVISGVAATNVATFNARIDWTTATAADSQVEYGTTTGYGSITPLDANFVIPHSVTLTGLSSNTLYHYRVKSRNPPPSASGDGRLAISADGTFTTLNAPPPTVSSTNPSSVTHSITASQSVTIFGSNVVLGATITVGGLSGTTVSGSTASATTPFVFTSSSQVKFWWPNTSLVPASYTVTVTNPASAGSYSASLVDGFTVTAPQPTVTSTSPNPVTYGITSNSSVTIFGSNFVLGATITVVGGLSGTTVSGSTASATTPYVYVSSSQVKFYWPNTSLAPGSHVVQVVNPTTAGGSGGNLVNGFTVTAPQPTVTSTSPSSRTYVISANSQVSVFGSNFVVGATITVGSPPGPNLTGATVAGSSASATTPFVFVSSSQLRFWWPNTSLAPGAYAVQVTNPAVAGSLLASLASGFTVNAPQPTVTSTASSSVTYGITPNSQVSVYGSNFVVGATITVGSLSGPTVAGSTASAATPFVFVSSGQLKFWWPNTSLAPGAYTVQVTNPAAAGSLSASLASGFTVNAPQPTVTSTSPNPVTYGITPNSQINVYGSNFVVGATITVGTLTGPTVAGSTASAATPFVHVSSGQLKFWWPNTSLATGPYTVQVMNSAATGGLSASLASGFTVSAPQPTVTSTSLNPVTYGVTSSRSITVYGTNFVLGATITVGSLTGATVAGSSATAATPFVFTNSGQVKFWWPNTSLPVGSYTVTVTESPAGGGLGASLANGFTVQ